MKDHVGIVGTGIYLPKDRMTAKEISDKTNGVCTEEAVIEKLGIKSKVVPSSSLSDGTQEMGALAALDALKTQGLTHLILMSF
nr:hypothetical protein QOL21_03150 [Acholeplasma laidlawii]